MSVWNHYSNFKEAGFRMVNETPGLTGVRLPPTPKDVNTFFQEWSTRGSFAREEDGYPYWSYLRTVQSWFDCGHQPNILLLHYADMRAGTPAAITKIAGYLGLERTAEQLAAVQTRTGLDRIRADGDLHLNPTNFGGSFDTFFFKDTNGRWQEEITPENLALYDQACKRTPTPECREWMEERWLGKNCVLGPEENTHYHTPDFVLSRRRAACRKTIIQTFLIAQDYVPSGSR